MCINHYHCFGTGMNQTIKEKSRELIFGHAIKSINPKFLTLPLFFMANVTADATSLV